jgi:hypothetical protein
VIERGRGNVSLNGAVEKFTIGYDIKKNSGV